jgi:hypothetical protein
MWKRKRGAEPTTTTTHTDNGNATEEEDHLSKHFQCTVARPSGTTLCKFKCDETTTVGWIREQVRKVMEEVRRPNTYVRTTEGFELIRYDSNILRDDSNRIHEQREPEEVDCMLTIISSSHCTTPIQASRA